MVPEEEKCLMSLLKWVTEILAMLPLALGCCSLVPMQTDGPHHYQASTLLWVEVQTSINRGEKERAVPGSARCQRKAQLSTYAIQMH